jgi:hypothetical protein
LGEGLEQVRDQVFHGPIQFDLANCSIHADADR